MDKGRIVDVGAFAESVLVDPRFNELLDAFDYNVAQDFLNTKPDDTAGRERVYATVNGFREFIAFMQETIVEARAITEPKPIQNLTDGSPVKQPAPESDEDVLDIYRED